MYIERCILYNNDCMKDGRYIKPKGIMVHSTGANNPYVSRYVPIGNNYSGMNWNRPGVEKCVHAFIGIMPDGNVGVCQTLPWTKRGWHAGVGSSGFSMNNTHIGFECCEDDLINKVYFQKVYQQAVLLCAHLCAEFDLDPYGKEVIVSHHEGAMLGKAVNHADIDHWFKNFGATMNEFRQDVNTELVAMKAGDTMDYATFVTYMERYLAERDNEAQSNWSENEGHFDKAIAEKVLAGKPYKPRGFITREEAIAFIYRKDELNHEKR